MILDRVIDRIADEMPKMNKEVICERNNRELAAAPEFIAMAFDESSKFLNGLIKLKRHETLDPEQRLRVELRSAKQKFRIPCALSHIALNEFVIDYGDDVRSVYQYTFYTHHNMLWFNGRRTAVFKGILEKTFSRVQDKQNDGISVSAIRVHMLFGRRNVKEFVSVTSGEIYRQFLITARLYYGSMSKKFGETTILTYLLAKFGFPETLRKFGISKNDVQFTDSINLTDGDKYEYFLAMRSDSEHPPLYLRVKTSLLDDPGCRKFVVNLLYVLSYFDIQNIRNVYDKDTKLWMIIIGTIISGDLNPARSYNSAEGHFTSVDHFIDPITRDRFKTFGVDINDIYDLLVYVFSYIDDITVNSEPQNLFTKRFDVSKGILSEAYGKRIFKNMYDLSRKSNPTVQDIRRALRLPAGMFMQALNRKTDDNAMYITRSPEIVGDNWLFACGLTKIRLGGKPEQRLHPSVFVVESGSTFSGKTINMTGAVNPYVPIDDHGGVIRPDYADRFEELTESLAVL